MICARHGGPMLGWNEPLDGVRSQHQARGLCRSCYNKERRAGTLDRWKPLIEGMRGTRAEVAAHVAFLRDTLGMPPEKWAPEVGTTVSALARRMYRAGRPDLARPLQRMVDAGRVRG